MSKKTNRVLLMLIIVVVIGALLVLAYKLRTDKQRDISLHQIKTATAKAKSQISMSVTEVEDAGHMRMGLLGSELTLVKQGEPYIESGAYCVDNRSGYVSKCEITGKVDTHKPGDYEIKYSFVVGNAKRSISRTVRVIEANKFEADTNGVPVLMYHYVAPDIDAVSLRSRWCVSISQLDAHMKYLHDSGFYFPSFSELRAYIDGKISLPAKSVIVTFDDGGISMFKEGLPILNKYKIPATQFMIGKYDALSKMCTYAGPYISFQSHSYNMHFPDTLASGESHHQIGKLSKSEIIADLTANRDIVGNNHAFAYPYGDYTPDARSALRDMGVLCSFTIKRGKVYPGDDPTILKRIGVYNTTDFDTFVAGLN